MNFHGVGLLEERVFTLDRRTTRCSRGVITIKLCLQSGDRSIQMAHDEVYSRYMNIAQRLYDNARNKEIPVLEYVQTHADEVDETIEKVFLAPANNSIKQVPGPFFTMPGGACVCSLCLGDKFTETQQQGARLLLHNQSVCDCHYSMPSLMPDKYVQRMQNRRRG